jgi:hypothetical protein
VADVTFKYEAWDDTKDQLLTFYPDMTRPRL